MVKIAEILKYLENESIPFTFYGDDQATVTGFSSLSNYSPGTFTWIKSEKNIPPHMKTEDISLAFSSIRSISVQNLICTVSAKQTFLKVIEKFYASNEAAPSIGENTYIGPRVVLEKGVVVGHGCVLDGDIHIGAGTRIWNNVTIINRVTIGCNCEIRSGVVMGHDDSISGTAFADDSREHDHHFGGIVLMDNVIIGENSTLCRGTIDNTVIETGVWVDALTMISHNCYIKKGATIIGASRLFGSVTIEEGAQVVSAIVRNQCTVGAHAMVGMGSVVVKDVPANETVIGNPAKPFQKKGPQA